MDQELIDFISKYLTLASFRNMDVDTPIKFETQPDSANANRRFIVVVSLIEPTFSQLPYNVLWLPADTNHPAYGKCLRRSSHNDSGLYSNTWDELTAYADLWTEDQYYLSVVEDPRLHGITTNAEETGPATASTQGLVVLSADEVDSRVVSSTDPRNTDARYPIYHTHPDYPRTMVKINSTAYALVSTSAPPQQGMMLFLVGQNPENANEWYAVWKFPTEDDIVEIDTSLVAIAISGPTSVQEQTSGQLYSVTAYYANGDSSIITPDAFDTNNVSVATVDTAGNFETFNVTSQTNVILTASYTEDGVTVNDTHNVSVTTGIELVSIAISGLDEVDENTSTTYNVVATYSDGSTANVLPDVFTSSQTSYATINGSGQLNALEVNGGDKSTVLNAEYTFDGVTRSTSKVVNIIDLDPLIQEIVIIGPNTVTEGNSETYSFKLVYDDGSEVTTGVVPETFSQLSSTYSTLDSGTYTLTANALSADQSVRLEATFTEFGTTVSGYLDVTLTNNPPAAVSAQIIGAASVTESTSASYILRVTYDDASTQDFTSVTWAVDSGSAYGGINSAGVFSANAVSEDQTVVISAETTINSVTVSDTHNITVLNEAAVPVALNMSVQGGGTTFDEGDTITVIYTVDYSDGTTGVDVKSSPGLSASFSGNAYGSTLTGSDGNDVLFGNVTGDQTVTLQGSYNENGTTVNDSIVLTVQDLQISPRWGVRPNVDWQADFSTQAFIDSLDQSLDISGNSASITSVTDATNAYVYIMYPKSYGHIQSVTTPQNGTAQSGNWDFVRVTNNDADFDFPYMEVNIGGADYYIRRTDSNFVGTATHDFTFGSTDPYSYA